MITKLTQRLRALFHRVFKNETIRRIVKNASYLVSAQGVSMLVAIVQPIFVLNMIGPVEWGLISNIRTFANNVNRVTSFRINEMVVSYFRSYEEQGEREKAIAVFKLAGLMEVLGAILAFILIWLLAPWGSGFFGNASETQQLWVLFGTVVLLNFLLDSSKGLLQANNMFAVNALINAATSVVTFLLVVLIYYTKDGTLIDIMLALYLGKAFNAIAFTVIGLKVAFQRWGRGWWRTPLSHLRGDLRGIFNFSFNTNLTSTISMVTRDSEPLWVSSILGLEAAGYYALAHSIAKQFQSPILSIASTSYPELSREIANKRWRDTKDMLWRISRIGMVYSLPIIGGLLLVGKPIISLLYGSEWLPAYPLLMILIIGFSFEYVLIWNRVTLLALKQASFPTIMNFIGLLVKIAMIFLLVGPYGETAFAWALSAYMVLTVGGTALRAVMDINRREQLDAQTGEQV